MLYAIACQVAEMLSIHLKWLKINTLRLCVIAWGKF